MPDRFQALPRPKNPLKGAKIGQQQPKNQRRNDKINDHITLKYIYNFSKSLYHNHIDEQTYNLDLSEYDNKQDFIQAKYMVIAGSQENLSNNLEDELSIITSTQAN